MPPVTPSKNKNTSAKTTCEKSQKQKLGDISKSIDPSKLDNQSALPVDKFGRVKISPSHPDYKYWTEDDK